MNDLDFATVTEVLLLRLLISTLYFDLSVLKTAGRSSQKAQETLILILFSGRKCDSWLHFDIFHPWVFEFRV